MGSSRSNPAKTRQLIGRIREVHSAAKSFHSDIETLIKRRHEVLEQAFAAHLTVWERATLHGYAQALFDAVWFEMEWRLGFADVSTARTNWPYGEKPDGSRNIPTHGGHFWKGTDIPFNGWNDLDKKSEIS